VPITELLLPEFDTEIANTRKTLERVPEEKLDWKPHAKSGAMGWLAGHVANLPSWITIAVRQDSLDLEPGGVPPPRLSPPQSRQELLALFDRNVSEARAALAAATDDHLAKPWTLLKAGRTIFTMPRYSVLRISALNHLVHHRAQLGVYLRLNDVPVPALYGPSADEGGF